mmetsp:Transcript_97376/g.223166  ORF Transcript_97376/g.223166 Transcript_97376/m.223166 type:complete len:222 (-) Transcript_97376:145-810(-)
MLRINSSARWATAVAASADRFSAAAAADSACWSLAFSLRAASSSTHAVWSLHPPTLSFCRTESSSAFSEASSSLACVACRCAAASATSAAAACRRRRAADSDVALVCLLCPLTCWARRFSSSSYLSTSLIPASINEDTLRKCSREIPITLLKSTCAPSSAPTLRLVSTVTTSAPFSSARPAPMACRSLPHCSKTTVSCLGTTSASEAFSNSSEASCRSRFR